MSVFILVVVFFLQNGPVTSVSFTAPSQTVCEDSRKNIEGAFESSTKKFKVEDVEYVIEDVETTCLEVNESI